MVAALRCLKGIEFVAYVTLVAELSDLLRFANSKQLMTYLGLVPSEHSSGSSRSQGSIIKTSNGHVPRMLFESPKAYRNSVRIGVELTRRNQGRPLEVREIAWRAQLCLCGRFHRMRARRLQENKVCIAIARELIGFVLRAGRIVQSAPSGAPNPHTLGHYRKPDDLHIP